jgi:hypothetical protein
MGKGNNRDSVKALGRHDYTHTKTKNRNIMISFVILLQGSVRHRHAQLH